jgi:hypothetical protein
VTVSTQAGAAREDVGRHRAAGPLTWQNEVWTAKMDLTWTSSSL